MCGIVSVVRAPGARTTFDAETIVVALRRASSLLARIPSADDTALGETCEHVAAEIEAVDELLRSSDGVATLLWDPRLLAEVEGLGAALADRLAADIEPRLDLAAVGQAPAASRSDIADPATLERTSGAVVRLKDALWAITQDRVRTVRAVADLGAGDLGWSAVEGYSSIQQALTAIDRLEVRGRDSAGLYVLVRNHDLDLTNPGITRLLAGRADPLFRSGAVRTSDGHLAFVYKAAAEIGELGDNTAALRDAIRSDELLRLALAGEQAVAVVVGHTRWASVGIISEANAHPFDSIELERSDGPFVIAALNGDVDNFADLKALEGLSFAPEHSADAKVIPTLVSRRLSAGADLVTAFRDTVSSFEGSVAIVANAPQEPERVLLALRGSGQALYVGLVDGAYVAASEPYGVIELADRYVRLDGETPANPDNPAGSRGQIVALDGARAGTLAGIERIAYDGTVLPVDESDLIEAQITTRDIDRGDFPHYLLKEITEAPTSFRKTLRGKLVERDGNLTVTVGVDTLPDDVRFRLRSGAIRRIVAIGQGTAAVAAQGTAAALELTCGATALARGLRIETMLATELSGFGLRSRMDDTLIIAISQSGTTTDTNRTVDVARARGAKVVAIVNRRQSDLTDRADGVLYTSDGRDVEMSVASTKAFYSQVAAGFLLAASIARECQTSVDAAGDGSRDPVADPVPDPFVPDPFDADPFDQELLRALRDLPAAMAEVVERREMIMAAARGLAPSKRYWAVVGNGGNRVAAAEVRIKLSELCYKSIACDSTEDKKHIDLSAEPLILVCAAGLDGSIADDVAKEVAIYRAHAAAPVVIATDGEARFASALHVLSVPRTHPALAFVLSTMVGHLFGYEAALSIDALAVPLRRARGAIQSVVAGGGDAEAMLQRLRPELEPLARAYFDELRIGSYDGVLEASTAVRLGSLLRYSLGVVPLDAYQVDEGKVGTPAVLIEDLTVALTDAIDELTRPVDAIKHQAKTVTVGVSRSDETLLTTALVRQVLEAGAPRDQLSYGVLRTLAAISPAIDEVVGHTRYRIEPAVTSGAPGAATITVVSRDGIARDLPSRVDRPGGAELRGTKHRVANEREVLVAQGRSDGRPIVLLPEVKDGQTTGITLLHVRFAERLDAATLRSVLQGYRDRYAVLHDAVRETEPTFREDVLVTIPVAGLLTEPISQLADRWRDTSQRSP
jgi:glutamine---fructose-6-phosphate transaminase (isomerizing)